MIDSNAHAHRTGPIGWLRALCPAGRAGPGRRRVQALPARVLTLAAALWAGAAPPAAAQAGSPPPGVAAEQPQQEALGPGADGPVIGTRIGPGLTVGGYGTLQLIVPGRSSTPSALPAPGMAPAGGPPGARWQGLATAQGVSSLPGKPFTDAQAASRSRLSISHLSAMLWWEPSPVWKLLAEVDSQEVLQLPHHESSRDGDSSSPYLALERLYVEHRASDAFSLRMGKFLTPIGRWNQDHPDPLTWTTLRPLISQSAFPTNATGVMAFGSLPGGLGADWQAFASGGSTWRSGPRTDPFTRAAGARLLLPLTPEFQLGASAARFQQMDAHDDRRRLVGLDAMWTGRGGELSAEIIERRGPDAATDDHERGWFVQAVVPLVPHLHGVVRIEAYRRAYTRDGTRTALVGVVWRSGRHWVFKAEWVRASPSDMGLAQGLLASMTALF